MAVAGSNPTVRRLELARRLRQLRTDAGRTIEDAAQELLCSVAKISRMETGDRPVQLRDVRDLCRFYGVPDGTRDELMQAAVEARRPGWWQDFRTLDEQVATYIGLEDAASSFQTFEIVRMPGLLQNEDYSRALIPRLRPPGELTEEWINDTVVSRTRRQERVSSGALTVHAIIDEAVLRRPVGDDGIMRLQVERLLTEGRRPNVTLQVIPFANGPHPGMDGSFEVLSFATASLSEVVFVEGLLGNFLIDKAPEVDHYLAVFADLGTRFALSVGDTMDWLETFHAQGVT
jgi:transcriptional regulator with XRE-family HTH domain